MTATAAGSSSAAVVSGGSLSASLRASSPFQTAYLSVIDDPLDGYYKLDFPAPTTDTTVIIKLGSSIPAGTFQTVFSVALGTSVGPSSSIANTTKTTTSVVVAGTAPTLGGAAQQFTATANFSDNSSQDVTSNATWASSATGVATVSSTGLVSAVAAGTATITATYGGVSGNKSITISAAATTFTVSGTVNDANMPTDRLSNVTIAIGSQSTTTDISGNYSLSGISGGSVTVSASANSYVTSQQTVSVSGNTTVNFSLNRTPTATITIQQGPCATAPSAGPVNCIFVGSSSNFISGVTYSWTFQNPANGMTLSLTGQQVQPTFDCNYAPVLRGQQVQATVTLTVTGGTLSATAPSQSVILTRTDSICG